MRPSKRAKNNPPSVSGAAQGHLGPTLQVQVESVESWQGPLPSPRTLEEFRAIVPDGPERIFQQWETESAHRRAYEMTALRGEIGKVRLSQIAATLFALMALGLVGLATWLDHPWIAGILGGGTITSVVGAFLYDRTQNSKTN